jgi:glycosyltransferase involved in cell wall biosynthesis
MKIYINREPKIGPWGGGAKTLNKLVQVLRGRGHEAVFRLQESIDIIFCFDPRRNRQGADYHSFLEYREKNPNTKIIQRVGDVGTHGKPELTNLVGFCLDKSDYFIFPSMWAKEYIGFKSENGVVICNAPMPEFYKFRTDRPINKIPRIITHHWSTNPRKGFETYRRFDEFCKNSLDYEFYYVGATPAGVSFRNSRPPIGAEQLANLLPSCDIYLTASEEEAGANHVVEAMACGLPVVYKSDGGSIVDYCEAFGEQYETLEEMISAIQKVSDNYSSYKEKVLTYNDSNDKVIAKYIEIIEAV